MTHPVRKSFIYDNDIKFKHIRELNINTRTEFYTDKTQVNEKTDTLEFRLLESRKNNFDFLDLSHLNLENNDLVDIINRQKIDLSKIKYLFINDNKLTKLDVSKFINLEVLDIENNKLETLITNDKLKELVATNNKLTGLPANINPIRIKISNNLITQIPYSYSLLELLEASDNKIVQIHEIRTLTKLIIDTNPLEKIGNTPNLIYLDISHTKQVSFNAPILKHLVAISTKLTTIPNIKTLETIEVINTPIERVQYFPNYSVILCSYNLTKNISSKFVDLGKAFIKLKNNSIICISREETQ